MARMAGVLLVLVASVPLALGGPLCCLLGTGCCGEKTVQAREAKGGRCPHCRPSGTDRPAPTPCQKADGCSCKSDVTRHAPAADHAMVVAVAHAPAAPLPLPAVTTVCAASHRALPLPPASSSHPLLL